MYTQMLYKSIIFKGNCNFVDQIEEGNLSGKIFMKLIWVVNCQFVAIFSPVCSIFLKTWQNIDESAVWKF